MKKPRHHEKHLAQGKIIENLIWGGQDGLVNVLGLILGVAIATGDSRLVLIAGLAGTFAESISMAAVAFTSQKAAKQYYESEKQREIREMRDFPEDERQEVRVIFEKKGFKGADLERAVEIITSNKEVWLEEMMTNELNLGSYEDIEPKKDAVVVGISALIGSIFPLIPFFFVDASLGMVLSLVISLSVLFIAGAIKSKYTIGDWKKSGLEMAAIGSLAAIAGFIIGFLLQGI